MADFQIAVFITNGLYYASGENYDAQTWCKRHIEEAISIAGYSVEVLTPASRPAVPNENIVDAGWPVTTDTACSGYPPVTYNNLLEWFVEWHHCEDAVDAKDANILVSNERSTYGLTTGAENETKMCVAEGSETYRFDSHEAKGTGLKYSQMGGTVLHEIGHAITEPGPGDWNEEQTGVTWPDNGTWYTSPMVTFKPDQNECGETITYDDNTLPPGFGHYYSDCVKSHLRPL